MLPTISLHMFLPLKVVEGLSWQRGITGNMYGCVARRPGTVVPGGSLPLTCQLTTRIAQPQKSVGDADAAA